jgi:hypothetical protein
MIDLARRDGEVDSFCDLATIGEPGMQIGYFEHRICHLRPADAPSRPTARSFALDRELHRQLLEDVLTEPDDQDSASSWRAALSAIEQLVLDLQVVASCSIRPTGCAPM